MHLCCCGQHRRAAAAVPAIPTRPSTTPPTQGALGRPAFASARTCRRAAEPAVRTGAVSARHLCFRRPGRRAGQPTGSARQTMCAAAFTPRGTLSSVGGSGTCAGWPRPRFVVVVDGDISSAGIIMPRRPNDTLQRPNGTVVVVISRIVQPQDRAHVSVAVPHRPPRDPRACGNGGVLLSLR
jgi:hypothetical protein